MYWKHLASLFLCSQLMSLTRRRRFLIIHIGKSSSSRLYYSSFINGKLGTLLCPPDSHCPAGLTTVQLICLGNSQQPLHTKHPSHLEIERGCLYRPMFSKEVSIKMRELHTVDVVDHSRRMWKLLGGRQLGSLGCSQI